MELDGIFYVLGLIFGWPLRWFKRWLDQQPDRDVSRFPPCIRAVVSL
jgi:hypothetical protein